MTAYLFDALRWLLLAFHLAFHLPNLSNLSIPKTGNAKDEPMNRAFGQSANRLFNN
jgi:hypothetical protein